MRHQFVSDQFNLLLASQIYLRESYHKELNENTPNNNYTDYFQRISELVTQSAKMNLGEKKLLQEFHNRSKDVFRIEDIQPFQITQSFDIAYGFLDTDSKAKK